MDHYLVLILAEVLDQIAPIGIAIKGQIMNFLKNSYSSVPLEKGELDASGVMTLSLP